MRPVIKGARPNNYSPPNTLRFNGQNATLIQSFLQTNNPTLSDCRDLWLRAVRAQYLSRKPRRYKALLRAAKLIENRIKSIYKSAASSLLSRLGEHCSYCGGPLSAIVEVEHVLPKSEYPTFSTDWDNFLLSCGPCNNKKKTIPSRTEVRNWLGIDITTENDCLSQIRDNHYVWPDKEPRSHQLFNLRMVYWETQTKIWTPLSMQDASDLSNRIVATHIPSLTVEADIGSIHGAVSVRVLMEPDTSFDNHASTPSLRAQEMIDLCGLNEIRRSSASYDRRVFNRTKAWFTAISALNSLVNATPQTFDLNWNTVGPNAEKTGFFDVWFTLFQNHNDPHGVNLGSRFVREFQNHFPNTDLTHFP